MILIPLITYGQTWVTGSSGNRTLINTKFKVGNGISELSIDNKGNLLGPYYYNGDFISVSDRWRNLTYDNIALNSRVGIVIKWSQKISFIIY